MIDRHTYFKPIGFKFWIGRAIWFKIDLGFNGFDDFESNWGWSTFLYISDSVIRYYGLDCISYIFLGCKFDFSNCITRNVVMIKSSKDTRYAVDAVVTHDGTKFPCWSLPNLSSFKQKFGIDAYEKVRIQFFLSHSLYS